MDYDKLITERYSVRKFRDEHLSKDILQSILEAGHKAPTGCNYQPQRILVLNTDESLAKLKNCTKCHFDAPCAMLVCHNKEESWKRPYDGALSSEADAVIVTTYLMLKAWDLGVGSCYVMHFDPEKIRNTYNIPPELGISALLVMGYPAEDSKPLKLHFENRNINEVVSYENF